MHDCLFKEIFMLGKRGVTNKLLDLNEGNIRNSIKFLFLSQPT